jgi:shikimate kinase
MGYYDYHPTVSLRRPVVLTGFYGSAADGVGQMLTQRTGLPLIELDRWIEHEAGGTLASVALSRGEPTLRSLEGRLLVKALAERPPGVIVLGEGGLLDDKNLQRVKTSADLVVLTGTAAALVPRAEEERELHLERPWQFCGLPAVTEELVEKMLVPRRTAWARADMTLDVAGRSATSMAADVLAWLRAERGAQGIADQPEG